MAKGLDYKLKLKERRLIDLKAEADAQMSAWKATNKYRKITIAKKKTYGGHYYVVSAWG